MEVLFFILIIVFLVANDKKSKQKKAQGGKAAPRGRAAANARIDALAKAAAKMQTEARSATEARSDDDARPAADARPPKAQAAAPKNVTPVKVASQQSPIFMATPRTAHTMPTAPKAPSLLDEEGCVGGSMAHTHEEGESREEHRRHIESARLREAEETLAAQAALELREMNLNRLRRAVVMAEILDRPKALRRFREQ